MTLQDLKVFLGSELQKIGTKLRGLNEGKGKNTQLLSIERNIKEVGATVVHLQEDVTSLQQSGCGGERAGGVEEVVKNLDGEISDLRRDFDYFKCIVETWIIHREGTTLKSRG